MIGPLFVVQVPDSGDKRCVPPGLRPIDGFMLRPESGKHVIGVIFHNIVGNRAPLRSAFGSRFNVNICHTTSPSVAIGGVLTATCVVAWFAP